MPSASVISIRRVAVVSPPDPADPFTEVRPRLIRIAYRMLGSVAEAEDIVQEAWLRWHRSDAASIREPEAFLVRMVTRLCLDQLKSARIRRETYVGTWLPEPVVDIGDAAAEAEDDAVTLALMLALESLSPLERAAFLLHDVFGNPFEEVAAALGRDATACRQLASRARTHLRDRRPRFPVAPERGQAMADAFLAASRSGDVSALRTMLADDVVLYSDGGGRRPAALNPIYGLDKVSRFLAGVAAKHGNAMPVVLRRCLIDGLPGLVTMEDDQLIQTTAFLLDGDRIRAIYVTRNPDKLHHLSVALLT